MINSEVEMCHQEVLGVGISGRPGVTFSSTAGIAVASDGITNFSTVPPDLLPMSAELLANSSSQALGVQFVVHGQPAVQMPHSLPVSYRMHLFEAEIAREGCLLISL